VGHGGFLSTAGAYMVLAAVNKNPASPESGYLSGTIMYLLENT
jgi:hypothetical protein